MNIVDYIILVILLLFVLKGFRQGALPSLINFIGTFLIFIIAFYLKQPISTLMYENLPFFEFAGFFKGIIGVNILFYEVLSYGLTILILGIIFGIVKKISVVFNKLLNATIVLSIPNKLIGAIIGSLEGLLFTFILLCIGSAVNTTTQYVNDSKYAGIILNDLPIINNVTNNLTNSFDEVYNTVLKNKNNVQKANLETIDILMKYNILSYDSATKLVNDKKLNIDGVRDIIEKYRSEQ